MSPTHATGTKRRKARTRERRGLPRERELIYRMQAEVCRALGNPRRLAILDLLSSGEKSTAELLRALGASKVNLSQHLAVMKHVGLVVGRQEGRQTFYRLAFPEITQACRMTREVLAARLAQTTEIARALSAETGAAARP